MRRLRSSMTTVMRGFSMSRRAFCPRWFLPTQNLPHSFCYILTHQDANHHIWMHTWASDECLFVSVCEGGIRGSAKEKIPAYKYLCVCVCARVRVCMYVCASVFMCVHVECVWVHMCMRVHVCKYVCEYTPVYVHLCFFPLSYTTQFTNLAQPDTDNMYTSTENQEQRTWRKGQAYLLNPTIILTTKGFPVTMSVILSTLELKRENTFCLHQKPTHISTVPEMYFQSLELLKKKRGNT